MEQIIRKAGDIDIEKVNIVTSQGVYQDIALQVIGIQIFEDIYSPFITGTIEIRDSLDLLNVFPLNGEEYLDLKLSTPTLQNGNIDKRFYIFKMSNRIPVGDKSAIYTLHFISVEALLDVNKRISKAFSGKCSDIAKYLLTDKVHGFQLTDKFVIEETSNSTKYISNFWSPVKNMIDVCNTSINQNGNSSYLFFESRNGFNFVSLEFLYKQQSFQSFVYDNYVRDVLDNGTTVKNINEDYKRIRNLSIPTVYDYIERNKQGMFASKLFTYDLTTKKYNSSNYDMLDTFKNQIHLNEFPMASAKTTYRYNSFVIAMTKYTGNFSGYGDVTNASSIQNRTSLLAQSNSSKIEIVIPGRLDYTVGLKVQVKIYKAEPTSNTDTEFVDNMLSGNYIISAINHYINKNKHECTVELIKDSLLTNLDLKK